MNPWSLGFEYNLTLLNNNRFVDVNLVVQRTRPWGVTPWSCLAGVWMEKKWQATASRPTRGTKTRGAPREDALGLWDKGTCCLATGSSPRMGPRLKSY